MSQCRSDTNVLYVSRELSPSLDHRLCPAALDVTNCHLFCQEVLWRKAIDVVCKHRPIFKGKWVKHRQEYRARPLHYPCRSAVPALILHHSFAFESMGARMQ